MSKFASIYVGCKQLGIEEDDRRSLYQRLTGKTSLKKMSFAEIKQVETELKKMGFKKVSKRAQNTLEGAYAKKLQALWIGAWNLGIVKNKSDKALLAFVKRQTGVDHTRFLRHAEDANKAIEALKQWMAREADVNWSVNNYMATAETQSGFKIAWAQYHKLYKGWQENSFQDFIAHVRQYSGKQDVYQFYEHDWIPVMNAFGTQIRDAK